MRLRRILLPCFIGSAFIVAVGCRYDWTYVDPESEGGKDDGGVTEGSINDTSTKDTNLETEASPPPPPPIGCSPGSKCDVTSYCRYGDGKCGKGTTQGQCQTYKGVPCESQTACSCGGTVMDKCASYANGFDVDVSWNLCGTGDSFKCGTTPVTLCKRGLQFCHSKSSGVPIGCKDIKACALGCQCPEVKAATTGGCTCDDKPNGEPGAIYVTCP